MPAVFSKEVQLYAPTGTIYHQDFVPISYCYRDSYNVWVVLKEKDNRYMKHIRITSVEKETGSALMRIIETMKQCAETGPEGMTLVEDGGLLPIDN